MRRAIVAAGLISALAAAPAFSWSGRGHCRPGPRRHSYGHWERGGWHRRPRPYRYDRAYYRYRRPYPAYPVVWAPRPVYVVPQYYPPPVWW
ncbi:MAG: hypothetical protein PHN82_01070 [bacterium]|nr:hypothetical protein [bacterium]